MRLAIAKHHTNQPRAFALVVYTATRSAPKAIRLEVFKEAAISVGSMVSMQIIPYLRDQCIPRGACLSDSDDAIVAEQHRNLQMTDSFYRRQSPPLLYDDEFSQTVIWPDRHAKTSFLFSAFQVAREIQLVGRA